MEIGHKGGFKGGGGRIYLLKNQNKSTCIVLVLVQGKITFLGHVGAYFTFFFGGPGGRGG